MAIEQHTEGEEELLLVIQWLTDEFGLEVDQRTIHRVAMEEWALFDRAKVRLYVCPISWRLARHRLREHLEVRNLDDGVRSAQSLQPAWMILAEEPGGLTGTS